MIHVSNDETNCLHKLLLTDRQVWRFRKAFANNLSAGIKLSKAELSKIVQSGRFLERILDQNLHTLATLANGYHVVDRFLKEPPEKAENLF